MVELPSKEMVEDSGHKLLRLRYGGVAPAWKWWRTLSSLAAKFA
jgi:hypothetical protein